MFKEVMGHINDEDIVNHLRKDDERGTQCEGKQQKRLRESER
jgi:hypothetical protein